MKFREVFFRQAELPINFLIACALTLRALAFLAP